MIEREPVLLVEGAIIERLRRRADVHLDPRIENAGLIYDPAGRTALEEIYRGYIDVGRAFGLPMIILTPTWRANPDRLAAAGLGDRDVNGDGFRFLDSIRRSFGAYADRILIGGLMGCAGDAYDPEEALSEDRAATFHRTQALALADAGVDFLMAATLPAASEAVGIAKAMADCGVPYVPSFVIRPAGTLLDGTPLHQVVTRIDTDVEPAPLGYMVNCVHPTVLAEALTREAEVSPDLRSRMLGLQANASTLSPEELDNLDHVDETGSPEAFAREMLALHRQFGLKILGGCCGTDERHIRCIAEQQASRAA
jgi:homocysteine S-methyltransferase